EALAHEQQHIELAAGHAAGAQSGRHLVGAAAAARCRVAGRCHQSPTGSGDEAIPVGLVERLDLAQPVAGCAPAVAYRGLRDETIDETTHEEAGRDTGEQLARFEVALVRCGAVALAAERYRLRGPAGREARWQAPHRGGGHL